METYDILHLQKKDRPELEKIADYYGIETEEKGNQVLIYSILDAQLEIL